MSAIAPPLTPSTEDQGDSSLIQESNEPLATSVKVEDTTAPMDVDKDDGDDADDDADADGDDGDKDVGEDGDDTAENGGDGENNNNDNDNDDGDDKNEDASKSEESKQMKVDPPPTSPTPSQTLDVDPTKTAPELSDEDKNTVKDSDQGLVLGGTAGKKAYALLTGKFKDKESVETTLSVPLTTLPAILGRNSTNEHIFELGDCKRLSRKHAIIFYSDVYGGRIGKFKTDPTSEPGDDDQDVKIDEDLSYRPPKAPSDKNLVVQKKDPTTEKGFFAITCTSKNKIIVDGKRVEQGETAILKHRSTIKLLTFTLYFLLPDADSIQPKSITVPSPVQDADEDSDADTSAPVSKKQKTGDQGQPPENRPLPDLVKEFLHAVETDSFERKHSMISTSILQYAVVDAANDVELRAQSDKEGGVSRTVLMEWIVANESYRKYVNALLTKLEVKSYQQNLSRALIKGGFVRLGTTGRHIKWLLPERKPSKNKSQKKTDSKKGTAAKEEKSTTQNSQPKESKVSNHSKDEDELKGQEQPDEAQSSDESKGKTETEQPVGVSEPSENVSETPMKELSAGSPEANDEMSPEQAKISDTPMGEPESTEKIPEINDSDKNESNVQSDVEDTPMPSENLDLEGEDEEDSSDDGVSDAQKKDVNTSMEGAVTKEDVR